MKKKLLNSSGESITETLVAVLISAFALLMLAGMINSSSRLITQSSDKLAEYYEDNNKVAEQSEEGKKANLTISGLGEEIEIPITTYKNEVFKGTPIVSYKMDN